MSMYEADLAVSVVSFRLSSITVGIHQNEDCLFNNTPSNITLEALR